MAVAAKATSEQSAAASAKTSPSTARQFRDQGAGASGMDRPINVNDQERWVSGLGGGVLTLYGLRRGGWGGLLFALAGGGLLYRGITGHCDVYAALGLNTAQPRSQTASVHQGEGIKVEKSVTINQPAERLFQYWRNFENLPQIMQHLEAVQVLNEQRSHWRAKAPAGMTVEWDAEIITEEPNRLLGWRSVGDAQIPNAGSVRFDPLPNDRGTIVKVALSYEPPGGKLGAWLAKLFGEEPEQQVADDLRRFKQMMEAGEVATVKGQPSGKTSG
jgi:uncharacterized membrane protein